MILTREMQLSSQFMNFVAGTSKANPRLDSVDLVLRHWRERFSLAFPEGEGRFLFRSANFAAIYGTRTIIVNRERPEHDLHIFCCVLCNNM